MTSLAKKTVNHSGHISKMSLSSREAILYSTVKGTVECTHKHLLAQAVIQQVPLTASLLAGSFLMQYMAIIHS